MTIIDKRATALQHTSDALDIMTVEGNGTTIATLREAGVEQCDLLIAATNADEQNLLTCLIAKRAGAQHTIARVRSPEYAREISLIQSDLGLSLVVNPELSCAREMARVLRFPSAAKIDTFSGGRMELLKHQLTDNSPLAGRPAGRSGPVQSLGADLRRGTRQGNLHPQRQLPAALRRPASALWRSPGTPLSSSKKSAR